MVRDIWPEAACHLVQSCAPNDEFTGQLAIPQKIEAGFLDWVNQTGLIEASQGNQCDFCQTLVSEATALLGNPVRQQPSVQSEYAAFLYAYAHADNTCLVLPPHC